MKFIVSDRHAYNLATINEIYIYESYMYLATEGGQASRDIRFIRGSKEQLEFLFDCIMEFIGSSKSGVLDCDKLIVR